jgi:nickel transport protein
MNRYLGLFFILLNFSVALAHKVSVYAEIEKNKVIGEGFYSDGSPTVNATIKVYNSKGELIYEGKTSKKGYFEFPCPQTKEIKIVLYAGLGHLATFSLNTSSCMKNSSVFQPVNNSISGQSTPISEREKEKLAKISKRETVTLQTAWKSLLCGLGWIFSIFLGLFIILRELGRGRQ